MPTRETTLRFLSEMEKAFPRFSITKDQCDQWHGFFERRGIADADLGQQAIDDVIERTKYACPTLGDVARIVGERWRRTQDSRGRAYGMAAHGEAVSALAAEFGDVAYDKRALIWGRWSVGRVSRNTNGCAYGATYSPPTLLAALRAWRDDGSPEPNLWRPTPPGDDRPTEAPLTGPPLDTPDAALQQESIFGEGENPF